MEYQAVNSNQKTILMVDDQTENLVILAGILKPYYRVKAARSGKHALEIARVVPRPDMILLDMMMPEMDGFAVLDQLLARPETADIPVIFVTASHNPKDEENAFVRGAVDYITKPFQPPVALARVRLHLALKQANDELARQNSLLEERVRERTKELEEYQHQLLQTEKMASIGLLAGGIAHDFNNILTPIIGYCELLMDDLRPGNRLYDDVRQIFLAGLRAKDLVSEILTFARKNEFEKRPIRIASLVKETLKLLRASLPVTIELRQEFDQRVGNALVSADPSQVQSILMNLCTNATYAMRDKGGVLLVELSASDESDAAFLRSRKFASPAARLKVSDTGLGMDEAIRRRIFEPYFTTKPPGDGTGLGLSVTYGIVMELRGVIDVKSQLGVGSTFIIYLPLLNESAKVAGPVISAELPKNLANMRVMFVDDDEAVLTLGGQLLRRMGMRVESFSKSTEALASFLCHPDQFDLVITDQSMSKLTGAQLAKEMTAVRPNLPVLLCSGNPQILTETQLKESGARQVLTKPFQTQSLIDALRQIAGQKQSDE
jgi:CheY-like chemotaxis protein